MRKLWVPLSLLLLLLIVCDWQHRNSFNQPMTYSIIQHSTGYDLKGTLKSEAEIKKLKLKFLDVKKSLNTTEAEKNSLLESRGSISVVEALLPLFVSKYQEGKIVYANGTLVLSGKVETKEIKQQIQRILDRGNIPTKKQYYYTEVSTDQFYYPAAKEEIISSGGLFCQYFTKREADSTFPADKKHAASQPGRYRSCTGGQRKDTG